MADEDAIVVETVAEVVAVDRETLEVMGYPRERQVHLMQVNRFGDLQSITFPADKADEVCAAIMAAAQKAMGRATRSAGSATGDDVHWSPCCYCNKHHVLGTPCIDPKKATRKPGDPQSETHGIQAVKRHARENGNG